MLPWRRRRTIDRDESRQLSPFSVDQYPCPFGSNHVIYLFICNASKCNSLQDSNNNQQARESREHPFYLYILMLHFVSLTVFRTISVALRSVYLYYNGWRFSGVLAIVLAVVPLLSILTNVEICDLFFWRTG